MSHVPSPHSTRVIGSLATGFLLSVVAAVAARALRLLTRDGMLAAVVVGTLVFGSGGWYQASILVIFVATSSALTRWQALRKFDPEHTTGRTGAQVLANGAVATLLAMSGRWWPTPWTMVAYAGAIAAATADTWATEVGLLSHSPPRLITTWQIVPRGQSGGVTWLGTLTGSAGALAIGAVAGVWGRVPVIPVWVAGTVAMLVDSVLGATIERRWRWVDNNTVNLLATACGAVIGAALRRL